MRLARQGEIENCGRFKATSMPHVEPNVATIAVALLGPVCEAHRSCRNPTT